VIRLLLVDDQTILREGLRALVEEEPDLEVVGEAPNVRALDELAVEPHVVVTGLALPDAVRDEVIEGIRDRFRDAAIVALTTDTC